MYANQISRDKWLAHVAQWRASGLSINAYCRQSDIKSYSLKYWIAKAGTPQTGKSSKFTFVAAVVGESRSASITSSEPIILRCPNGIALTLPTSVSPNWLAQVLVQLK